MGCNLSKYTYKRLNLKPKRQRSHNLAKWWNMNNKEYISHVIVWRKVQFALSKQCYTVPTSHCAWNTFYPSTCQKETCHRYYVQMNVKTVSHP
uniref:Uncharacterized protein n=1 Tax=Anguilla anguilla TaxID=7936 RepID=A0A0E9WI13_ANGAN